jgi:2-dehydro-3-deoxyphosphogluconate aldolase / (4S)-4-hydroxy-2-oxoglutarate aldolase
VTIIDDHLAASPIMIVIRGASPEETVRQCRLAWALGVEAVEVTIQTPDALPSLQAAIDLASEVGRSVGAGSVHTMAQWESAVTAGASFTVAAATVPAVIEAGVSAGIPHVPGVATGTDVATALGAGATWVKAFPAALLTPAWVRAVQAPFPHARFLATGGIDARNAQAFLDAGCGAVAFGSSFSDDASAEEIRRIVRSVPS